MISAITLKRPATEAAGVPSSRTRQNGITTAMTLFLETTRTIQEIAKFLKRNETNRDLKHFYSRLMAHCVLVHSHANRIKAIVCPGNQLILQILDRFESIVTTHVPQNLPGLPFPAYYPRLESLNKHWDRMRDQSGRVKLDFIRQCLDFGLVSDQHNEFLESLENWEDDLTTQFPEDSQWSKEDFVPRRKGGREPSYAVWNAAQSLFKALMASKNCTCQPIHEFGARLCLGTYRKPDLDEDFDFDMFLSLSKHWQEVHIHTAKESVVQFALNSEVKQPQTEKLDYRPMKVKKLCKLCEPIEKIQRMTSQRLKLKVERGQLWKLRSEKSCFQIDRTRPPVTLQHFITERSRSLTEKTKRILAVLLSYTVLHFYGTPWLQRTWGSSSILFFHTASSMIPLRPYIQTQLVQESFCDGVVDVNHYVQQEHEVCDPDDFDPDDIDPDDILLHHCPSLVTLAVMLIELYMATPVEILAKKYGVDLPDGRDSHVKWIDADMVFKECKSEIPENSQFRYAVEKCLDPQTWEDGNGKKLDNQTLRIRVYEEIVRPLEDELSQAFSYISVEELDKIARTLDFGCWGQTIQNQQAEHYSPRPHSSEPYARQDGPTSFQYSQYFAGFERHFHRHGEPAWGHLAACDGYAVVQRPEQRIAGKFDYEHAKFFDDETVSEDHSSQE